jgi:hypothetical protein
MSSGLGGVGFADGFVNGFGMVDQALQRRRANEIENKKIEQDQANNLAIMDFRNKELGLQGEKNSADAAYNTSHLALTKSNNEASQLNDTNKLQADINQNIASNKLTAQSNANQANYQNTALKYQQQNQVRDDNLRASIEKRSVDVHDMEIAQKTFELDAAKQAKKKQEDLIDLSNSIGTNEDGTPSFHLKNGDDGIKQINQFKSSGIDLPEIARNMPAFAQHVENLKTALMDPSHGNKQQAIAALNVTEKIDINQGLGKQEDGTTVTSKEISDVIQHQPEAGYPDGYYSFAIKSIGTDAQGNPQVREGDPMTQYRSSSPYDQNVQRVTPEQLTKRVATQENLINFVNSNPKLQQQILKLHHEAMPKEKDGTKSVIYKDNYDSNTGVNTKTPDAVFDNKSGVFTPIAGQSNRETEIQKKASIVLQNPEKFSKEQVDYANQVLKNSQ